MHSDLFMNRAVDISVGSLSPTINWGTLKHQEFIVPPKEQQVKFSELLLSIENSLQKSIELLDAANSYKESVIEENLTSSLVGGVINDYCDDSGVRIGPFGSLLHKADYQQEGIPVIMPADIENGVIQEKSVARISVEKAAELDSYRLKENDILFPRRGDLTKRAIIEKHQEGWICGTGSLRVRLKKGVDPKIVYFAVTSISTNNWLLSSSVGTTMPNLNAGMIKKIPLHLPEGPNAMEVLNKVEMLINSIGKINKYVLANKKLKALVIEQVF